MNKPRIFAFYLPQFHPIPENDEWWGKGFTEWTNVGKAKKYFPGHYQPRVPADLGYYDLRVPEVREQQAALAKEAGIEGFCYWHYWFGNGKRLLERPFKEVLESGKPDFPFCLAWANESWKGLSHGLKNRETLIEQFYPGVDDYTNHFYEVLPAFLDKRYITIDNKPVFMIYKPLASIEEISIFIKTWRELALKNDLSGIYFIGQCSNDDDNFQKYLEMDLDAINTIRLNNFWIGENYLAKLVIRIIKKIFKLPLIVTYDKAQKYFLNSKIDSQDNVFATIISGWDHTPRSGKDGLVMTKFTPNIFSKHVKNVINISKSKKRNIIFLKSWNEWAEGNYIEPDLRWGSNFLKVLYNELYK